MDNEINAFGEGVTEGGLRNTTQIKIFIEYIVDSLKDPLTAEMAVEAVTRGNLANYFEVSQALSELMDNNNIVADSEGLLYLTPKGQSSLTELIGEIPASVKEKGLSDAAQVQINHRNAGSNTAVIVKSGEGYNVICTVLHKGNPVMSLTLYAADFAQAENIKTNFMDDPAKVYASVISILYS